MKKLLLFGLFCLFFSALSAQCPELTLVVFQDLQRATSAEKEARILGQGFDLQGHTTERGATVYRYRKCWETTVGDLPIFEQVLFWDQGANSLLFATLELRHFESLKKSILERHGATYVSQNPDYYVGKMFQYRFGTRRMDGREYYTISIALK